MWSFTSDANATLRPGCAGLNDFTVSFIVCLSTPAVSLIITLITFLVSKVARMPMNTNRFFSVFMSIVYTFYIAISLLSLC